MAWVDSVYAGATVEALTNWAKQMWWPIWIRQSHVNYVGMWKRRFEKEDQNAEKELSTEGICLTTNESIKAKMEDDE